VVLSALFLLACWPGQSQSQSIKRSPCAADATHSDWRVYINNEFHFCLRYPPTYHEMPVPPPNQVSVTHKIIGSLKLNNLPPDTHGSPVGNNAGIYFVYIPKSFSTRALQTYCAPTGLDDTPPAAMHLAGRLFYLYGPGGGGVDYADRYMMEIKGKILSIQFDGPWKDSKSPIDETKRIEPGILSTLRTW
jgi:hypothetical protein